jgi:hypothetical protein
MPFLLISVVFLGIYKVMFFIATLFFRITEVCKMPVDYCFSKTIATHNEMLEHYSVEEIDELCYRKR